MLFSEATILSWIFESPIDLYGSQATSKNDPFFSFFWNFLFHQIFATRGKKGKKESFSSVLWDRVAITILFTPKQVGWMLSQQMGPVKTY